MVSGFIHNEKIDRRQQNFRQRDARFFSAGQHLNGFNRQVFLYRKDTYKAPRVLKEIPREQRQVSKNIHGTITNSTGVPLPGVSVTIKGTRDGIITDANGDFKLHNIPPNVTLVISFIGMRSQEIKVGSQESFNIILQDEAVGMNEVVVIGYTTQRKATITGSISTITTKDLDLSLLSV